MQIEVSGHAFTFPQNCACCFGTADAELTISASKQSGKKVIHTKTNAWDIPYCKQCLTHVGAINRARMATVGLIVFSVIASGIIGYLTDLSVGFGFLVIAILATAFIRHKMITAARLLCTGQCAAVGSAVSYLGWYGSLHCFDMLSTAFYVDFMRANERKLVNLSAQARQLMATHGIGTKHPTARTPRRYLT